MKPSVQTITNAILFGLIGLAVVAAFLLVSRLNVDIPMNNAQAQERSFAGTIAAPDFPQGLDWLNTGPLTLSDLKGKVVLLDFWTYGCINCIHIIPDLKKLEEKYADELVVIGVHSAKFDHEGNTDNIRNIILRYEVEHPVINDKDFQVWQQYGARAWPTLVLIDPLGNVVGYHAGEGIYDLFDEIIAGVIDEFADQIDPSPVALSLEQQSADTPLLFPGKVLADEVSERLFITDSNHNRIVITDLAGNVLDVIGKGEAGFAEGSFEEAQFSRPQGLSLADENTLYVADTENHSIRKIDLKARKVETVVGIGEQVYQRLARGPAKETGINSPWDVLYHEGLLYIAMAGQHQLWVYDAAKAEVRVHAGSGREELKDGTNLEAGLNQPSGLATDGEKLYIADSEASAIRTAGLSSRGQMTTIVGTGLFDFGDVDGQGDAVRLQHPLGVQFHEGILYVADTYNNKIKQINPQTQESSTFLGGGTGWQDGVAEDARFYEPGGLSIAGQKLYIADTNNHVIRVADLVTKEVETLVLVDTQGYLTPITEGLGEVLRLPVQHVMPGEQELSLEVSLPEGYQFNDLAPFSMEWISDSESASLSEMANQTIVKPTFPLNVPLSLQEGETLLTGDLVIYYCEYESVGLCLIEQVRLEVPIQVSSEGDDSLSALYEIALPLDINPSF